MSSNRVIGKNNKLPRHLPEDLQRFKQLTKGSTVVMGRQTYESLGKPLAHRKNIVITSNPQLFEQEDVICFNDPELAYDTLQDELSEHDEVFIIGGATLYTYFLDRTERLYLTEIKDSYSGDTFFPAFEEHFEEVERVKHEGYDFVTYRKRRIE